MGKRWILWVQVAAVAGLCAASLWLLWSAGTAVVARQQNRDRLQQSLAAAEERLARAGASGLLLVPPWPETLGRDEWAALDAWLSDASSGVVNDTRFPIDAGYFLVGFNRFLGRGRPRASTVAAGSLETDFGPSPEARGLVEAQIRKALDADRAQSLLVEATPRTLAIHTAPVWVNGRQVAATWTTSTLDDTGTLAGVVARYQLSAALALGGMGIALLTAIWLARTVRSQSLERTRLEHRLQRTQRLAALGKLVAGVAHEIRNPLAGIRSSAQLVDRGIDCDGQTAQDLIAEVDRLDAIVARLLQFSRVGHEAPQPLNVNDLVRDAARLVRPHADAAGVHVEFDLDHGAPPVPVASASILQLLRNLTTNAIQAMPRGGLLRLSTSFAANQKEVIIRVIDSGPGLDESAREHLFEPFFTTKPDGTGLGLAIAREIALAHGGRLWGANRGDAPGAVFALALPLAGRLTPLGPQLPDRSDIIPAEVS